MRRSSILGGVIVRLSRGCNHEGIDFSEVSGPPGF